MHSHKVAILWRSKATSFLYNSGLGWFLSLLPLVLALLPSILLKEREEKRLSVVYRKIALIPTPLPLLSLF